MRKQQQGQQVRPNASQKLHRRLITRETYQLINCKRFGTASSRNERQLEKKMKTLHTERTKTLTKLRNEIHEMRTHHKMLREVDETARDPRTADEKARDILEGLIANDGELTKLSVGKSYDLDRSPRLLIRKHLPECVQSPRIGVLDSKERPKSMVNKLSLNDGRLRPTRTISDSPPVSHKPTFLYGLLDRKVKRDASLVKKYNYNLESGEKLPREKHSLTMPELTQNARMPHFGGNTRVNYPDLAGNTAGKKNRHTTGTQSRSRTESLAKPTGDDDSLKAAQRKYAPPILGLINDEKSNPGDTCQKRRVHYQPSYFAARSGADNDATSSSDDATEGDQATSSTEDWGTLLSKCRYLRKPKGYETPEMTMEAIFQ